MTRFNETHTDRNLQLLPYAYIYINYSNLIINYNI